MNTKICTKCHLELPLSSFSPDGHGGLRGECKPCHAQAVKAANQKRREFVALQKEKFGCAKCGERRSYCLDFHHINPNDKDTSVSYMVSRFAPMDKVQGEIAKCIVLCANCHREFHVFEKNGMTIEKYLST